MSPRGRDKHRLRPAGILFPRVLHCRRTHWPCPECQLPGLALSHGHKDKQEGQKFKACLDLYGEFQVSRSYMTTCLLKNMTEKAQSRGSATKDITQPNLPTQVWPWDLEGENNSPSCPLTSTDTGKKKKKKMCVCVREKEGERGF